MAAVSDPSLPPQEFEALVRKASFELSHHDRHADQVYVIMTHAFGALVTRFLVNNMDMVQGVIGVIMVSHRRPGRLRACRFSLYSSAFTRSDRGEEARSYKVTDYNPYLYPSSCAQRNLAGLPNGQAVRFLP